jgi:SAM-dependent methyltransferase
MKLEGVLTVGLGQKGDGKGPMQAKRATVNCSCHEEPAPRCFALASQVQVEPLAVIAEAGLIPEPPPRASNDGRHEIEEVPESSERCPRCLPLDDVYIEQCYQRILELDSCESRAEIIEGINTILSEMADKAERENGSYTTMVDSMLMLHWTRREGNSTSYDEHMQEHVDTIALLTKAWISNKTFSGRRVRVLDASCGTGKVLEAFLDAMPHRVLRKLRIVANDVSSASIEAAKKTLARFEGKVRIDYTPYDLTQQLPEGRFDLILFSQTLPFICDEKALRDQRLGLALPNESRHITAKRHVLEALMGKVKPGKGDFLLIDEHPMRLSKIPDDFEGIVEDVLFREIFRPISRSTLINDVMKRIDKARFRGHIESFIDREHSMYLIDSTVDKNHARNGCDCTVGSDDTPAEKESQEQIRRIIKRAEGIHQTVVPRLQEFESEDGTTYKPIGANEKRLVIDPQLYDERIDHKPGFWRTNGHYNMVVISDLMHQVGIDGYRCVIEKLKRSGKVGPGSALLFIDKWPPPPESLNPVGNSDARTFIFNAFDDHVFLGSIRCGDKYGYLYVVRNL